MKNILLYILFCFLPFTIKAQAKHYYMLAGTYTWGKSQGIYVYDFNDSTGNVSIRSTFICPNPSYLAISANGKFIYTTNQPNTDKKGTVTALSFKEGMLKKINTQLSGGEGPCYVTLDNTGKWLAVANYFAGTFSILPVKEDGSLGEADTTIIHIGKSINKERQEKAHAHCSVFAPNNKYLYVTDLGMDKIMIYSFDETSGKLKPAKDSFITVMPGEGPRHLTFHPNNQYAYLINELTADIVGYEYNENGYLKQIQVISSLSKDYTGAIGGADVHVSPDGKFLYTSNRGDANSISIFSIDNQGLLTWVGYQSTLGKKPRNFNFDPSGNFLLVANQDSDTIVIFKRNIITGLLTDIGNKMEIPNPVCIKWIKQ